MLSGRRKTRSRAGARRGRHRRDQRKLLIASIFAFFILVGGGVFTYFGFAFQEPLRGSDFCPLGEDPDGIHIVVLDKTDPWPNEETRERIKAALAITFETVRVNERIQIYIFSGESRFGASPIVDLCSPGRGEEANTLVQTARLQQERYEDVFLGEIDRAVATSLGSTEAEQSPLIEVLFDILQNYQMVRLREAAGRTRITIISDMMQNTPDLSLYRGAGAAEFRSYVETMPEISLEGTDVNVIQIRGTSAPDWRLRQARTTWTEFFQSVGATIEWDYL